MRGQLRATLAKVVLGLHLAFCQVVVALGQLTSQDVVALLQEVQETEPVPAVFAAVAFADRDPIVAAVGVRKLGDPTPATVDDLVHIGSCTKAMTAVLIARLVEQGKLNWHDTIAQHLPELSSRIDAGWHNVTLAQMLSHTSGMPANARNWWLRRGESINEIRDGLLVDNLRSPPGSAPGTRFLYSNLGYMAAGHIAGRVNGTSWEEAIQQHVFAPLGILTAGFGPPGTAGGIDQPWGHVRGRDGAWICRQFDNAPALGPAGTVHLSMRDWCRFVRLFMDAGPEGFLSKESYQVLTTPVLNDYALGWGVAHRQWAEGLTLSHSGSNTMWDCVVWVAPTTKRAYLVAVNGCDKQTSHWNDHLVGRLIELERSRRSDEQQLDVNMPRDLSGKTRRGW